MRAAILGPLSFLIVPALLWPPDMLAVSVALLQGACLGAVIGFGVAMAMNAAPSHRR